MRVAFDELPKDSAQMTQKLAQDPTNQYFVAGLVVAALCRYPDSPTDCEAMIDVLKGPEPMSNYEKQFLRDRFDNKPYIARSYFEGATPQNGYEPDVPFALDIQQSPDQEDGWSTLLIKSGGADSPRQVRLRQKKSTGEWFLAEQMLLAGIRVPESEDPWA